MKEPKDNSEIRDKILIKINFSRENGKNKENKKQESNILKLVDFEKSISGISFIRKVGPSEALYSGITVDRDVHGDIQKYIQYDFVGQLKFTEADFVLNDAEFNFPVFRDKMGKPLSVLHRIFVPINGDCWEDILILNKSKIWLKYLDVPFLDFLMADDLYFLSYQGFANSDSNFGDFEIESDNNETSISEIRDNLEKLNRFEKINLILELKSENSQVRIPISGSDIIKIIGEDFYLKYRSYFSLGAERNLFKNNFTESLIYRKIHAHNYKFAAFVSLLEHDEKFIATWHEN